MRDVQKTAGSSEETAWERCPTRASACRVAAVLDLRSLQEHGHSTSGHQDTQPQAFGAEQRRRQIMRYCGVVERDVAAPHWWREGSWRLRICQP